MEIQYRRTLTKKVDTLLIGWYDFDGNKTGVIYDANQPVGSRWTYFSVRGMRLASPLDVIAGWIVYQDDMPELTAADAWAEYDELLAAHKSPPRPAFDALAFIIQAETEGFDDNEEIIYGLQQLKRSGLLYQLQGSWQRMARAYGVI